MATRAAEMPHVEVTGLVWGADVGGTSTRVGVADVTGRVLAVAVDGPGNPATVGLEVSADRVCSTARRALDAADPGATRPVLAGVIGLAGVSTVDPVDYGRRADPGRTAALRVVADLAVAYASGTPARHGVVALAGTGAGAMEVRDGAVVRRHDAWGWLLGDDGSAQWLGRAAVRHTLSVLEGGGPTGPLAEAVLGRLDLAGDDPVLALIQRVYADPPNRLAALAPLVSASPDPAATAILDQAADRVTEHALTVLAGRTDLPVVLAGSLAAAGGPLHDRLLTSLAAHGTTVSSATDGVAGACWSALALTRADPLAMPVELPVEVHRRLLATLVEATRHTT